MKMNDRDSKHRDGRNRHWTKTLTSLAIVTGAVGLPALPGLSQFTSPPGQGTPGSTAGGGSRPTSQPCLPKSDRSDRSAASSANPSSATFVAFAPTRFLGFVEPKNPAVWVYVPPTLAKTLEFSLVNQQQEGVYQTELEIQKTGLVKIPLPASALAANTPYYWSAALVCNPDRRTEDWVVGGWITQQSLPAALQQQQSRATPEQRVQLYVQSRFWYEAFNTYMTLKQTQPQHPRLAALWSELLKTAGMQPIAPPDFSQPPSPQQSPVGRSQVRQ